METVQQNGRLKLFSSKFPSNIFIISSYIYDPPSPLYICFSHPLPSRAGAFFTHQANPFYFYIPTERVIQDENVHPLQWDFCFIFETFFNDNEKKLFEKIYISVFWCFLWSVMPAISLYLIFKVWNHPLLILMPTHLIMHGLYV